MAEEATVMAEEVKPEKKVAFANRKYTNEEKRKKEEEELEQMMKEQRGEAEETAEPHGQLEGLRELQSLQPEVLHDTAVAGVLPG